jgi:iron complex outermembrane receptor protein
MPRRSARLPRQVTRSLIILLSPVLAFAQDADSDNGGLEGVVVTARNRVESAQEVPLPIAVLNADRLEREEIKNIYDLPLVLPNFVITGNNARNISPRLRGLGGGGTGDSMERSVGFIVDGVTLYYTGQAWSEYVDLDRIEVLRGPQGTLMGKNTTLGAVNIVTKAPTFDGSTSFELGVGDRNTLNGKFSSTGGLIDDVLAYRSTFSLSRVDGLYKNLYQSMGHAEETWRETNKISGRVQLLWTPTENLTGRFIFDKLRSDERVNTGTIYTTNGPATYANGAARPVTNPIAYTPTGTYVNYGFMGRWAQRSAWFHNADGSVYQPALGTTDIENSEARPQVTNQYGGSAQFDWKVGDYTLTSISAYRYQDFDIKNGGQFGSYYITNSGQQLWNDQISQELRLTSSVGNKLDYQLGLYYLDARVYSDDPSYYGQDAGAWQASNSQYTTLIQTAAGRELMRKSLDGVYQSSVTDATVSSIAGYGQLDWHLTDDLTLTGGLRQTEEDKKNRISQQLDRPGENLNALGARLGATAAEINAANAIRNTEINAPFTWVNGKPIDASLTAWNSGVNYKLTPDVNLYASVGVGVKSGFIYFQQRTQPGDPALETQIRPEKSLDYELGVKSLLLNNRLQLNVNLYQTKLTDYQASWARFDPDNPTNVISGWGNAEKVLARGVEFDGAFRFHDLTISLNGAYNEATYETDWLVQRPNLPTTEYFNAKGDQISNVPKFGANNSFSYELPLGNYLGTFTFSSSYRSAAYLNDNHAPDTYQKAYTVSNLGFGFGKPDGSWELSIYVKNVFDVDYATTLGTWTNSAASSKLIGDPRYALLVFRAHLR